MTKFKLSATILKHWAQYRCERQLRYKMTPQDVLEGMGIVLSEQEPSIP